MKIIYAVFQLQDFQAAVEWQELVMLTYDYDLASWVAAALVEIETNLSFPAEYVVKEWLVR